MDNVVDLIVRQNIQTNVRNDGTNETIRSVTFEFHGDKYDLFPLPDSKGFHIRRKIPLTTPEPAAETDQ